MQNAPREHSAILSTFIKLTFVIMVLVLSIFKWPFYQVLHMFYTGFIVNENNNELESSIRYKLARADSEDSYQSAHAIV